MTRARTPRRSQQVERHAEWRPRVLICVGCGRPLGGDAEDEPDGEGGKPICGACDRARNFDVMLEGELNGG